MNPKHEWFKLNKALLISLFIYYLLLLIGSTILICRQAYFLDEVILQEQLFKSSIQLGIIFSVAGATIFYIRKLYKACINLDIQQPLSPEDKIRQIGVFFYFFLRPAFSVVLSVITLVLIKSGIILLTDSPNIKPNFLFLSIVISFFVGYSCGDYIDRLEIFGKAIIHKVTNFQSTQSL